MPVVCARAEISRNKDNSARREAELLVLSGVCSYPTVQPRRSHTRHITEQTTVWLTVSRVFKATLPKKLILQLLSMQDKFTLVEITTYEEKELHYFTIQQTRLMPWECAFRGGIQILPIIPVVLGFASRIIKLRPNSSILCKTTLVSSHLLHLNVSNVSRNGYPCLSVCKV